eukprot:3294681-Prymnesium_polylepis.1
MFRVLLELPQAARHGASPMHIAPFGALSLPPATPFRRSLPPLPSPLIHVGLRPSRRMQTQAKKLQKLKGGDGGGRPKKTLEPEREAELRHAFNLFDEDKSGNIDQSEVRRPSKPNPPSPTLQAQPSKPNPPTSTTSPRCEPDRSPSPYLPTTPRNCHRRRSGSCRPATPLSEPPPSVSLTGVGAPRLVVRHAA